MLPYLFMFAGLIGALLPHPPRVRVTTAACFVAASFLAYALGIDVAR